MSIESAKTELANISDFQKELHGLNKEDESSNVLLHTLEQSTVKKTTWGVRSDCKLTRTIESDNTVFEASNNFHYLKDLTLHQTFPPLRVKDEYKGKVEIRYPHNLGNCGVEVANAYYGESKVGYLDTICLDIVLQFHTDPGQTELNRVNVGNLPYLEQWSSVLPRHTTITKQPFYFGDHMMFSIPLLLINGKVTFKYKLRNRLSKILKMRQRADEKSDWKEIPFNSFFLVDTASDATLPLPDMYGTYKTVSDAEVKRQRARLPITQYIQCFHANTTDSKRKYHFKETPEIDIKCPYPIHRLYPVAINDKAYRNNDYSNYSTNSDDVYLGHHPINTITLTHRDNKIYDEYPIELFDRREAAITKLPLTDPGYACCNFGVGISHPYTDTSLVFNDQAPAKMSLEIKNTDPYENNDHPDEEFSMAVRFRVSRKLTFNTDGSVTIT